MESKSHMNEYMESKSHVNEYMESKSQFYLLKTILTLFSFFVTRGWGVRYALFLEEPLRSMGRPRESIVRVMHVLRKRRSPGSTYLRMHRINKR